MSNIYFSNIYNSIPIHKTKNQNVSSRATKITIEHQWRKIECKHKVNKKSNRTVDRSVRFPKTVRRFKIFLSENPRKGTSFWETSF